jgi:hypothetical protein
MSKELLIVGIPTRDEYVVGRTLSSLFDAALLMDKKPEFVYGVGTNICGGRDLILKMIKERIDFDSCRMLWLDSDIWIRTPPEELAKYLREADEKNYNIVAPYRRADMKGALSSIGHTDGVLYWDALATLDQYAKVPWAGLGFYYGITPLNYKFYMSGEFSEDYHFFYDNKIELRVDKRIELSHYKTVFI